MISNGGTVSINIMQNMILLASEFASLNPTLGNGQLGIELDTLRIKVGDGTTAWNGILYSHLPVVDYNIDNNYIIDGDFQVHQIHPVGAEVTNPANRSYASADLWMQIFDHDGGTPPTIKDSIQSLVIGSVYGAKYCHRINVNGAGSGFGANSYYSKTFFVENGTQRLCGAGKQVTLSVEAITSIVGTKLLGFRIIQNYGTGGTPSADEVISGSYMTLSGSATKKVITFTTNTLNGKTFGTDGNDYLAVEVLYQWGSTIKGTVGATSAETFVGSGNIDITKIKLEAGGVATPFRSRDVDDELRKYQKYVHNISSIDDSQLTIGIGRAYSTTDAFVDYKLPVKMRIPPVILSSSIASTFSFSGIPCNASPTISHASKDNVMFHVVTNTINLTNNNCYHLQAESTNNCSIILDSRYY